MFSIDASQNISGQTCFSMNLPAYGTICVFSFLFCHYEIWVVLVSDIQVMEFEYYNFSLYLITLSSQINHHLCNPWTKVLTKKMGDEGNELLMTICVIFLSNFSASLFFLSQFLNSWYLVKVITMKEIFRVNVK